MDFKTLWQRSPDRKIVEGIASATHEDLFRQFRGNERISRSVAFYRGQELKGVQLVRRNSRREFGIYALAEDDHFVGRTGVLDCEIKSSTHRQRLPEHGNDKRDPSRRHRI